MTKQNVFTLTNPQNGNLAFKVYDFENNSNFDHLQRNNYYSLIWVTKGSGKVKADFAEHHFEENSLLAFSPYQPFMVVANENIEGIAIHFHPDFYCIHMHQKEVSCNGVLFNNIYEPPFTRIDTIAAALFKITIEQIKSEMQNPALAQYDLLVSFLKIILITASRLKTEQSLEALTHSQARRQFLLLFCWSDRVPVLLRSQFFLKSYQ